jgi:hypothetical protein
MERLPVDIIRLLILKYLDGYSACALMQTCKAFTGKLSAIELIQVRVRPASHDVKVKLALKRHEEHAEQRLAREIARAEGIYQAMLTNVWVCSKCYTAYPGSKEVCWCIGSTTKDADCMTRCLKCSSVGTTFQLFPWRNFTVTTPFLMPCSGCDDMIDCCGGNSDDTVWKGRDWCTKCSNLLCNNCIDRLLEPEKETKKEKEKSSWSFW